MRMNNRLPSAVTMATRMPVLVTLTLLTAACCVGAVASCTDVNGGAIDLSWTVRTTVGATVTCETAQIQEIRLWWQGTAPGSVANSEAWPCSQVHGVTGFSVDSGPTLLWVEPDCTPGMVAAAQTYETPAPVERDVVTDQVVSLNDVVIQVQIFDSCGPGPDACVCR